MDYFVVVCFFSFFSCFFTEVLSLVYLKGDGASRTMAAGRILRRPEIGKRGLIKQKP